MKPAYEGSNKYIFISYAHKDKDLVYPFIELLQEKYNVWYDQGIKYGAEWTEEIINKLSNSYLFIFLITYNSLNSENCKDEIHAARENGKNFINIVFDKQAVLSKEFKFRYGRFQMCNVFNFDSYNEVIEDLNNKCEWFDDVKIQDEPKKAKSKIVKIPKEEKPKEEKSVKETKEKEKSKDDEYQQIFDAKEFDVVKFGSFFFDKTKQPIEWIVLRKYENGNLLLVSKYILFAYSNKSWEWKPKNGSLSYYLNGTFLNQAFSSKERSMLSDYTIDATRPYKVKVHLLFSQDCNNLLPSNKERRAKPTPYAKRNGCKPKFMKSTFPYWTASHIENCEDYKQIYVTEDGELDTLYYSNIIGVRPTIVISKK